MKRTTIIIVTLTTALLSAGCTRKMLRSKNEEAQRAAKGGNMATPATDTAGKPLGAERLVQGENIFGQKCGKCHEYHEPGDFTVAEWNNVLPAMVKKAKLSTDDAGMVKAWIIAHAKQG